MVTESKTFKFIELKMLSCLEFLLLKIIKQINTHRTY